MIKVSLLLVYLKNGKKPPDPQGGSEAPSHEQFMGENAIMVR
jgi:hypothetical protein